MLRRYAFGGLTPPRGGGIYCEPQLITKYQVVGGCDGWIWMSIAGAWMGLGARLMAGWGVGSGTGVGSLRTGPLGLAYSTAP